VRTPVWPAIVRLTSDTASFAAATDEKGQYRFEAVPPGYYSRTVVASGGYSPQSTNGFITVRDSRGCVHDDVVARAGRELKGQVDDVDPVSVSSRPMPCRHVGSNEMMVVNVDEGPGELDAGQCVLNREPWAVCLGPFPKPKAKRLRDA
jgi:hypothetical protein